MVSSYVVVCDRFVADISSIRTLGSLTIPKPFFKSLSSHVLRLLIIVVVSVPDLTNHSIVAWLETEKSGSLTNAASDMLAIPGSARDCDPEDPEAGSSIVPRLTEIRESTTALCKCMSIRQVIIPIATWNGLKM